MRAAAGRFRQPVETGYRTPLLDYFRRGDAPHDVKLLAARGELAPRAHEQLALLMLLLQDPDHVIADHAAATIDAIPPDTLAAFLARSDVPPDTRAFFAARGLTASATAAEHIDAPLIDVEVGPPVPAGTEAAPEGGAAGVQVGSLSVPDKLKLAMRGTREQRGLLIRDSNRIVAVAVLSSPKLTESEVENFARMANVAEEVLRIIGSSRVWTRNYVVAASLVKNPKTPLAIALGLLPRLNERDVKFVSSDRGVAEGVRMTARKLLAAGQARRS